MNKVDLPKIKSPLRYPGGKSRALKYILPVTPSSFDEFREPMVGGGSVFVTIKQKHPNKKFWINDLNPELYYFWKYARDNIDKLVSEVENIWENEEDGRKLFEFYRDEERKFTDFERAVRFFVLNRISFSGTVDSGGYSKHAFRKRFTRSSIERLSRLREVLGGVKITCEDYKNSITTPGENVFIFLDPPYFSTTDSKLYGKGGDLHTGFDHERFAEVMKKSKHKWLITYDDCEEVRKLFDFANIIPWKLQYGMNNYKQENAKKGEELFILNYNLPQQRFNLR